MYKFIAVAALVASATWGAADFAVAAGAASPSGAHAYIGYPNDGQVVTANKPFRVWFGLRYMGVAPKGVKYPNTGHHHLLIDTDLPPMDQEIPSDRNHLHFGAGETETMIQLPPGKHTLQLLMGDDTHVPHNPPVYSKKITVIAR
ncbi:uncharacterized protein DUF4399 [Paraburkholderia sp. GV068]|jgi:hypothetical protein|uniref:DUF4399 domain-containing protein n=1 Tax=Paraburkholderia TaxID=1822464 RepID=UPI000D2F6CF2|nr:MULTISPECIES: DUF4399 domain-containing protein [Paraburkholderia]AXF11883.1 ATPase [Paraburkholderia graminis]MDR6471065.1 hypothetical protein [Paraburkholderia graminis]PTR03243.1 uncharacterized protein DUF4399 [Paraburkholderia sp. GV072]PUB07945.1 uncharacterized protein DUF4399 [Paraburkholderia sp. GV068]